MATRLEQILVKMGFDVSESSKVKDAMDKVNEHSHKAGEGVAGFNTQGREMRELIHKIGAQSPIMGAALKAAFEPESLGIIALIAVLEFVVEKFREIKREAKEAADTIIERWKAQNEAVREAEEAAENFRKKWDEIAEASAKALEPYKGQMKMLDQMIQQHEEVLNLLEAQELAAAKGDKVQEEAIKKRYQHLREEAGETSDAGRATLMRKHIADLVKDRDEAFEKAGAAQDFIEGAKARPPLVDREMLKQEQAGLEEATEGYQSAKEDLEYIEQFHDDPARAKPEAEARDKEIIADYEAKLKRIKGLTALTQKYDDDLKKAQEDFDKYTKTGEERDKESIATSQELKALLDKPTAAQTRKQVSDIQKQTAASAAKSQQLDQVMASDSTLQQALAGSAAAKARGDKAAVDYWERIVASRTAADRARFPGVPTGKEQSDKVEKTYSDDIHKVLVSIDSTLKGDQ
jgi:DNA repair exonuclease SbcCD ATPase subunit